MAISQPPAGYPGTTLTGTGIAHRAADFEPSRAFDQTYVTRHRPTYVDAAKLLMLLIIMIMMIPARLIVPGMTDLGRPGLIVGFLLFCWWILVRFSWHMSMTGPQPVRWAFLIFMITLLVSYAAGFIRGLTTIEANAADRAMLFFCVFAGVALTAADGIPNWLRLRAVLKVLVGTATAVSLIALAEYVTGIDVTTYLNIPGLQAKGWTPTFEQRGGGIRVASTTTHYIELAALLALVLPFAIHFALYEPRPRRKRLALLACLLIGAGIATTISRTGMLAVGLMFLVLFPVWTWRTRYNIFGMVGGLFGALSVASPGLYRTLIHLFDNPSSNPAFTVRQQRYPLAFHYVAQHPWIGRGTGTWVAPQYQILDNQWLDTLITNGVIGVAALAGLHICGMVLAWRALRRSTSAEDRHLCAAMISTQLIAIAVAGTFDSLSFMTYGTILALTLGVCGTAWRLTHPARTVRTSTTRWFLYRTR
ncbi:MAG: O-antigen ligase family protein [Micromonosporaceae bacterium]|nr:O-antigen ligase family protein [Micromonosporaceae bacterium]